MFDSVDSKNFGQYLGWECPGPNGEGYTGGPSVRPSVCDRRSLLQLFLDGQLAWFRSEIRVSTKTRSVQR